MRLSDVPIAARSYCDQLPLAETCVGENMLAIEYRSCGRRKL